jgi:hypothetical protein
MSFSFSLTHYPFLEVSGIAVTSLLNDVLFISLMSWDIWECVLVQNMTCESLVDLLKVEFPLRDLAFYAIDLNFLAFSSFSLS